jgi:hypothetical protein
MQVFSKNVGGADKIIRIALGVALTSLAFWGPENPWFMLGLIPLATGVVGWCGLYQILGINTCKHKQVMKM